MRLNAKSLAGVLRRPGSSKAKLKAQKYPKQMPQRVLVQYYARALSGIRAYYKSGKSASAISAAMAKIAKMSNQATRDHNARVLSAFQQHPIANRAFSVRTNSTVEAHLGPLDLRMSSDLRVVENGQDRAIYFHCRAEKLDDEEAAYTLEIGHWVAEQGGLTIPISAFEYVDLFTGKVHQLKTRRPSTVAKIKASVQTLNDEWNSL